MVMATKDMSGLPISIENDRNSVGPYASAIAREQSHSNQRGKRA
jgi:hypothetical protein